MGHSGILEYLYREVITPKELTDSLTDLLLTTLKTSS